MAIVAVAYLSGALDLVEYRIIDARMALLRRPASGAIVVVAIDGRSLQSLGFWPWPRALHADLLERLRQAGAAEVALDIDFSARSNPYDDERLEDALRRWQGKVALPAFKQPGLTPGQFIYSEPLPRFRQHARLASVNVRPDRDGLVRRMTGAATTFDGSEIPTLVALLGTRATSQAPPVFHVDYGIGADRIPLVSYADVLAGAFEPDFFRGKSVVVGATAVELGDIVPTPVWQALPGVLVQAIAAESVLQDRMLQRPSYVLTLVLSGTLIFLVLPRVADRSWRAWLAVLAGVVGGTNLLALAAQTGLPILLDSTPYALAALLTFGVEMAGRSERLSVDLITQGLLLNRQSRLMRTIVVNSFDALVTADARGRIVAFNPAAERLFGHSAAAIPGRSFSTLLADAGRGAAPGDDARVLAAYAERGQPEEAVGRHADGAVVPIELAVTLATDSEAPLYVAIIRDLTARKGAERQLNQAQQRLLDAIDSLNEGFALYDAEDHLVLCNGKYRSMFPSVAGLLQPGWRFEDIMRAYGAGASGLAIPGVEPDRCIETIVARHRDPGGAYELRGADGQWLQIGERRTAEGGVAAIVADISDLKRREDELVRAKEEAELASRSKSEFLANMSHELRTPLNAVIGFAELMESQLFGPLGHRNYLGYAADIRISGEHLLGVINDILDMSRVEAGKVELNEEAVRLSEAAHAAMRLISHRASDGEVDVAVSLSPELPDLLADARLVKQCLINLVSNAVKFTPAGGRVEVRASIDDLGGLALMVIDTGIGIAAKDIERVMAPFGQVDSALDRRYEGTGLGLPLVMAHMQLHDGELRLDSKVGEGTTATLQFPAHRVLTRGAPALASGA